MYEILTGIRDDRLLNEANIEQTILSEWETFVLSGRLLQ